MTPPNLPRTSPEELIKQFMKAFQALLDSSGVLDGKISHGACPEQSEPSSKPMEPNEGRLPSWEESDSEEPPAGEGQKPSDAPATEALTEPGIAVLEAPAPDPLVAALLKIKRKIGRWYQPQNNPQGVWLNQEVWESIYQTVTPAAPLPQTDALAVLFQVSNHKKFLYIQSPELVAAYWKVLENPPLSSTPRLKFSDINEWEPFPFLYKHLNDIKKEVKDSGHDQAYLDFQALELVANQECESRWKTAREEKFEGGTVTYDTMWTLFYPGCLVVRKDDMSNEWLLVLIEVKEHTDRKQPPEETKEYTDFKTWGLRWNDIDNCLTRKFYTFRELKFTDRRKITSLEVYPVDQKGVDKATFLEQIAKRGRTWKDLMAGPTICQKHDGLAMKYSSPRERDIPNWQPKTQKIKERMIIDPESKRVKVDDLLEAVHKTKSEPELDDRPGYLWDTLPAASKLTDEQAQLCPPIIGGISISGQDREYPTWIVNVENLEEVQWNKKAVTRLVLDEHQKNLLKGLVGQHSHRSVTAGGGDLIENKGMGLTILLYGPPGVGKTLTAESIAEYVGKPLIVLSIGDMIVDESQLEQRLLFEFERALQWDAILLLDEADVVLEARSFEDVHRNGIVSVFLRQLEYYKGVIFLTTNRISTMDVAFQSRIQVAIEFDELNAKGRAQVWRALLESRRDTIDENGFGAIEKNISKFAANELNGRQIRNVLNIAEGYAFNEHKNTGMMEVKHVQAAVKAALEFQKLFDNARSEAKMSNNVWAPYSKNDDSD